jgi:hypothetical protein
MFGQTDVHHARLEDYDSIQQKTGEYSRKYGLEQARNQPTTKKKTRLAVERQRLSRCETELSQIADRIVLAATEGDTVAAATEAMDFRRYLRELWNLRDHRSEDWAMIINFLQIALADEVFESFETAKYLALQTIAKSHIREACDVDDIESSLTLLEGAGLDPWKNMAAFRE